MLEFLNFWADLILFLVYLVITGIAILTLNYFLMSFLFFYLPHCRTCKFLSARSPVLKELVKIAKKENIFLKADSKLKGAYFQQFIDGKERIILSIMDIKKIEESRPSFTVFQKDVLLIALETDFAHELGHHFYYAGGPEGFNCSFSANAPCIYRELKADETGIKILIPLWREYYKTMEEKAATGKVLLNQLEAIINYLDNPEVPLCCKEAVKMEDCPKTEEVLRKITFFKKVLEEGKTAFKK